MLYFLYPFCLMMLDFCHSVSQSVLSSLVFTSAGIQKDSLIPFIWSVLLVQCWSRFEGLGGFRTCQVLAIGIYGHISDGFLLLKQTLRNKSFSFLSSRTRLRFGTYFFITSMTEQQ